MDVIPSDASAQNLARLLQLRWIAIAGQTLTIAVVHFGLGLRPPARPGRRVVAALALWNAVSWRHVRTRETLATAS